MGGQYPYKLYCVCLVFLGGAAAMITKGRGALQDIDQMALFKPICKYIASVSCVRDIATVLRTAIKEAQSGTPGKSLYMR